MTKIELLAHWQGGAASITVEGDELIDDGGATTNGLILEVDTPLDLSGWPADIELGIARVQLTAPAIRMKLTVAANPEQARELAAAILDAVGPE